MRAGGSQPGCSGRPSGSSKLVSAPCPPSVRQSSVPGGKERKTYRDELVRMFVDVPVSPGQDQFFRDFKETLKERFQQLDLWVTSHDIRVL